MEKILINAHGVLRRMGAATEISGMSLMSITVVRGGGGWFKLSHQFLPQNFNFPPIFTPIFLLSTNLYHNFCTFHKLLPLVSIFQIFRPLYFNWPHPDTPLALHSDVTKIVSLDNVRSMTSDQSILKQYVCCEEFHVLVLVATFGWKCDLRWYYIPSKMPYVYYWCLVSMACAACPHIIIKLCQSICMFNSFIYLLSV